MLSRCSILRNNNTIKSLETTTHNDEDEQLLRLQQPCVLLDLLLRWSSFNGRTWKPVIRIVQQRWYGADSWVWRREALHRPNYRLGSLRGLSAWRWSISFMACGRFVTLSLLLVSKIWIVICILSCLSLIISKWKYITRDRSLLN